MNRLADQECKGTVLRKDKYSTEQEQEPKRGCFRKTFVKGKQIFTDRFTSSSK